VSRGLDGRGPFEPSLPTAVDTERKIELWVLGEGGLVSLEGDLWRIMKVDGASGVVLLRNGLGVHRQCGLHDRAKFVWDLSHGA
jgi:hypothetical protein